MRPRLTSMMLSPSYLLVVVAISASTLIAECFAADETVDLSKIMELTKVGEKKCLAAQYEAAYFQWNGANAGPIPPYERRRITQWRDSFNEIVWKSDPANFVSTEPVRITWCNRFATTIQEVPGLVSRRRGWLDTCYFQPYEILLGCLGFDGPLSEFLQGDHQSLMPLTCELVGFGELDGFRTAILKGSRQFPGSPICREIELEVLLDNGCLPYRGTYRETVGDDVRTLIDAKVASRLPFDDGLFLMREIMVNSHFDDEGTPHEMSRRILLDARKLTEKPVESLTTAPAPNDGHDNESSSGSNYVDIYRSHSIGNPSYNASLRLMRRIALGMTALGIAALMFRMSTFKKT